MCYDAFLSCYTCVDLVHSLPHVLQRQSCSRPPRLTIARTNCRRRRTAIAPRATIRCYGAAYSKSVFFVRQHPSTPVQSRTFLDNARRAASPGLAVRIDEAGQSKPIKAAPTTAKAQHRKITSKRNAAAILSRSSLWRPVAIPPLLHR